MSKGPLRAGPSLCRAAWSPFSPPTAQSGQGPTQSEWFVRIGGGAGGHLVFPSLSSIECEFREVLGPGLRGSLFSREGYPPATYVLVREKANESVAGAFTRPMALEDQAW
jgi:hypothetical protein